MDKYNSAAGFCWVFGGILIIISLVVLPNITPFLFLLIIGGFLVALGFLPREYLSKDELAGKYSDNAVIALGKSSDAWILDNGVLSIVNKRGDVRSIPAVQIQSYTHNTTTKIITIEVGVPNMSVHVGAGISVAGGNKEYLFYPESDKEAALALYDAIIAHVSTLNAEQVEVVEQSNEDATSSADELLKFKDLLDAGVITQDEFDAKKKQILGL